MQESHRSHVRVISIIEILCLLLTFSSCAPDQQDKSSTTQSLQPGVSNPSSAPARATSSPLAFDNSQKVTSDSSITSNDLAVVKSLRANLREQPNLSSVVLEEVRQGESLKLVSRSPVGAWYRVQHGEIGTKGWIHGDGIVITNAITTEASKPSPPAREKSESVANTVPPANSGGTISDRYYRNVDGNLVHSPTFSKSAPAGASARCGDGSYSFSQHRRGTCSHHGGVTEWL